MQPHKKFGLNEDVSPANCREAETDDERCPRIEIDFSSASPSYVPVKERSEDESERDGDILLGHFGKENSLRTNSFLFQNELAPDVCLPQKPPSASFDLDTLSNAIKHFRRERTSTHNASVNVGDSKGLQIPPELSTKASSTHLKLESSSIPSHFRRFSSLFASNREQGTKNGDNQREKLASGVTNGIPATWESISDLPQQEDTSFKAGRQVSGSLPYAINNLVAGDYRFMLYTTAHGILQAQSIDELDDQIQKAGIPPAYRANESISASIGTSEVVTLSDVIRLEVQRGSWFWIDVVDPTELEMQLFMQIFSIHPLTIEDVMATDTREKCESFPHYYYVNMRTFNADPSSVEFLQPLNMNILVLSEKVVLSFHRDVTQHVPRVLKRMEQLMLYGLKITPDWINYALLDDIVDSFAPLLQNVELEVDSIDDLVLILTESEKSDMLRRIARERKKVMALLRLLSNKPDVVRTLIKRRTDRGVIVPAEGSANPLSVALDESVNSTFGAPIYTDKGVSSKPHGFNSFTSAAGRDLLSVKTSEPGRDSAGTATKSTLGPSLSAQFSSLGRSASQSSVNPSRLAQVNSSSFGASTAEFSYYLGDIQDNLITMLINLTNYEKTLSRSHSNYLAQISIELTQASNQTNDHVMKMSLLGSIFLPMNVICGLFGMNVTVPFEASGSLMPFFGIIIFMFLLAGLAYYWLKQRELAAMGEAARVLQPSLDHQMDGRMLSDKKRY